MTAISERAVWSKSQVSSFRECLRKGFLSSRFNLALEGEGSSPLQIQAARLKKLKNRHLWTGSVIHKSVGDIIKTLRQGGALLSPEEIIQQTKEVMRAEFKNSKDQTPSEEQLFAERLFAERLFEHEYGLSINPQVWQDHWNTVEKSLRWFLSSRWLERLKELGPEVWKAVDEVLAFELGDIKAYVKIDCAVETGGRFHLIDWKSSALGPDDQKNLGVAALYAHEVWGAEPEAITATAVSLTEGRSLEASVNEDSLMETYLRIQAEAEFLSQQTSEFNGDPFKIPMTTHLKTCTRCNFQKLCYPNGF